MVSKKDIYEQGYQQRFGQPLQPYDESGDLIFEQGELDQMSVLGQQMQGGGKLQDLWQFLQQGFDPMVTQQLNNLPGLQQQMLQGGFFGGAEEQAFRDMISGDTLREQGGTLYDMISEQFAPARDDARAYAASRGMRPGSGSAMSFEGRVAGDQQRAFAEQMVNKQLEMMGMGIQGLGQMGGEQFQRQQGAGQLGQWLSQFVEGSQQGRMGIGANIAGQENQMNQYLMNLHTGRRDQMRQKGNPVLEGLMQVGPMVLDAYYPGGSQALGSLFDITGAGQGQPSSSQMKEWFQ